MKTYDPNIHWAEHTVEVVFQQWTYQRKVRVPMRGNCRGMSIIESCVGSAISMLTEQLEETGRVFFKDARGKQLEFDRSNDPDDFEKMVVGVSIIKHVKVAQD